MFKKLFLRDINFPSEIKINEKIFKIEILFLKKRHANVILKENKLIFRISKYLTNQKKLNCFEELLEKMKKKIEKNPKEFKEKYGIKKVIKNRSFKFFEKIYFLDISKNYKNFSYTKNVFKIPQDKEMKIIENFISKKLIQENSSFLIKRINYLNEKHFNYNIKNIQIKNSKSKWGHCTFDNKIMINIKLLNTKESVLDYVIIHELTHIKIKNHSQKFWTKVEEMCFNFKELRKELRKNPPTLFLEN